MLAADHLIEILKTQYGLNEEITDQDYKYCMYIRKSIDDPERQQRTIGDQIRECEKLAEQANLNVIGKPIVETLSAKESANRPAFTKMVEDIKRGIYDAILCWSPDRLSRNMLEAGMIIDLLDKNVIKDLKFPSYHFTNDAAGKMLLAIFFATAKEYSDQLSVHVLKGIRGSTIEGKNYVTKHGYFVDSEDRLRPDGKNYNLIKKAWEMRLKSSSKVTLDSIADFLNTNGYMKSVERDGKRHKTFKMHKSRLSDLFLDSVYCGVLKHGDVIVDLTKLYDFKPMVTVEEFLKVNKYSETSKKLLSRVKATKSGVIYADLLRGFVKCGHCNQPMSSGITRKPDKNYYFYRCETKNCLPIKRGDGKVHQNVRAHVVVDFAYDFLKSNPFASKGAYDILLKSIKDSSAEKKKELERKSKSLDHEKRSLESKVGDIKEYLLENKEKDIAKMFEDDLNTAKDNLDKVNETIKDIAKEKKKIQEVPMTYELFLELFNKLPDLMRKSKSLSDIDEVLKLFFSNFALKNKKVASYELKSPFKEMVEITEKSEIVSGRGDRT